MSFIHDDFLLSTVAARRLFHEYAVDEPILDYHNHLSPQSIAENRQFGNLYEAWLEDDHYKWRAMRANGISEEYITGKAAPYDKFLAWATTVPYTLRNPLYHWTHLELKRHFGIDVLLDERTARSIWEETSAMLQTPELSAHGVLDKFDVRALCTTDDPTDDLSHHQVIADSDLATRVFPAFRPDSALAVDQPPAFKAWVQRLAQVVDREIESLEVMLEALAQQHDYFHRHGCRLSDHGLPYCFADCCSDVEAGAIFERAFRGQPANPTEHARFSAYLMLFFARLDADKRWTLQLHLGPIRNNNTRLARQVGADAGADSIGDWTDVASLGAFLDRLDQLQSLPKTIVYNVNPINSYAFATMIGNFQDGTIPGKMQFGSGWWYLDQKEGMEWQINTLSNTGLLSRFVGMLTDSRSFMSFPRHEYFRRTLCNLIGRDMENGELPDDFDMIGLMIRNICYRNAERYLALDLHRSAS